MVNLQYAVRNAHPSDHTRIANLMYFEPKVHRHLDWRTPLDWLGVPDYWVLEHQGNITAALACPPDPATVCWLRLFAVAHNVSLADSWTILWNTARTSLEGRGLVVAAIAVQDWLIELLKGSGFVERQQIVVLEHNVAPFPPLTLPDELLIRTMTHDDLPVVAEVDAAAFAPLWQNSLDSLQLAFGQAGFSMVAEWHGQIVGYQITTRNPFGAHLARLAVAPALQGRKIGYLMVQDLLQKVIEAGLLRLTVNTQNDNSSSLALYESIGFRRTGEYYTVFTCEL